MWAAELVGSTGNLRHRAPAGTLNAKHPSDDPKLPSFVHPVLRDHGEDLQRAYDAYHCLRGNGVKKKYLPQEPAEPQEAYTARLGRAVFADFFRDSIVAFAGVLSKFSLSSPPGTLEEAIDNIDREGNDLTAWFQRADGLMLRDGAVALRVEMPSGRAANSAEEVITGRRPYLVSHPRARVLNWRTTINDGIEELERVTLLEEDEEPDGEFGVETVLRYRVIGRGFWQLWEIQQEGNNEPRPVLLDEDEYLGANGQRLPVCPVVWYRADEGNGFGTGELPLRQVVEHCFEHFQERSDLREKRHKCSMPVPWVKGRLPGGPAGPDGVRPPVAIGPNTIIELEQDGAFGFAEPSATSLADQRQGVEDIERLISRQTLGFLYGDPGATKTAKQAGMEGAQTESVITRLAARKNSAMQSLMALWVMFTGETLDPGAGLSMAATLFEQPMEAQDVDQLQKLTGGEPLLSRRSAIEELQRRGRLKVTTSVDDELKRLADEEPPPADEVGLNDYGALPPGALGAETY